MLGRLFNIVTCTLCGYTFNRSAKVGAHAGRKCPWCGHSLQSHNWHKING
jgi:rubrerythrin